MYRADRFSPSSLGAYLQCPRKYMFAYVERLEEEFVTVESVLGSAVHDVLKTLYMTYTREGRVMSLDELLRRYQWMWSRRWSDRVRIVKEEYDPDHYYDMGVRCIENYYRRYEPFEGGEVVWIEEFTELPFEDNGFVLRLKIDRLDRVGDGCYEVHDYKTSGTLPREEELKGDMQLTAYQMAVEHHFPDAREVELVWHYLLHDREFRVRMHRGDVERVRKEIVDIVERIRRDEEFRPNPSPLCRWCGFRGMCGEG